MRGFEGKRLAQLLDDPSARGMLRDVNVQDVPPIMTDDEEAVEHAEGNRWHGEEIHGRNRFPMVLKKGQPALGPVRIFRCPFHPTRDGSLGEIKPEHAEFPMDPWCSPGGVLNDHTEDQLPNFLRFRSSSDLPPDSGDHPPIHAKTSPVPADHGFGRNDDEGQLPSRPDPSSDYPEELIEEAEARARMSTFQHGELLPKSQVFKKESATITEESQNRTYKEPHDVYHTSLLSHSACGQQPCILLKSRADRILAMDSGTIDTPSQVWLANSSGTSRKAVLHPVLMV